ncbi:MAG: gliding motility-associated C-terminal domain-containing protein [Vicingaceae bacterium]
MKKLILLLSTAFLAVSVNAQDVGVDSLITPTTACTHNFEPVKIRIKNFTAVAVPASTITVSYRLNGGSAITETVTSIIPASGNLIWTFSTAADMTTPEVNYSFKVYTGWASDVNNNNDTIVKSVYSFGNSLGGILDPADTVCIGSQPDTIFLTGYLGKVQFWQSSPDGIFWTSFSDTNDFFRPGVLASTTFYRTFVRNGPCAQVPSTSVRIQVDPASVGGTVSGAGTICDGINSGNLTLSGNVGSVVRWESSAAGTPPWTNLGNSGSTTLAYSNIGSGDDLIYRALVQTGLCPVDSSDTATFSLDLPSVGGTISQTAGNDTVCSGSNSGTLTLTGHLGTILRWEADIGSGFSSAGGAGSATFNFSNITATTTYRAVVKNGSCDSTNSSTFTIVVDAATVGGVISSNSVVCSGSNGGTLNLTGHVGTVIEWEQSINGGGTWTTILPVNTTTSQTYNNLTQTTLFRAQVKNGQCAQIPSAFATITVNSGTVGGTITTGDPTTVCAGNNSGTLTYSGGNGGVVRWESSTNGGASWSNIANLSTTENFTNLTTTTLYRVRVQNAPCPAAYSDTMTITVLPASVAGTISGTSPICNGSSVSLVLAGNSGNIVFWQRSVNGGTSYTNISGSAGQSNITPTVTTNTLFRVRVKNGTCDEDTSADFAVNVDPVSVGGSVSSNATVCGGNNSGTLTLAGNVGTISDWIQSTNGGASWSSVPGPPVTTSTYNYNNLTQTTQFKARVQSGVCPEDSSSDVTITVIPAAVGGVASINSPNDTVCEGTVLTTLLLSGQTGSVVQWQFSINGGTTYTPVPGAPANLTPAFNFNYTANTLFRALVQNGAACDSIPSTSVQMTVNPTTVGGIASGSDSVCQGTNSGNITLSGHVGAVVEWQLSTNNGATWTPIPASGGSATFAYSNLSQDTWYRALVKSGLCASEVSDTAAITMIPSAVGGTVTYTTPGTNVCTGSNTVTLNLSGSSGTILRWRKSINGGASFTNIANTTTTHVDNNLTITTIYKAVIQGSSGCPNVESIPDTVFVDALSDAGTVNGTVSVCDTGNMGEVWITGYTGSIVIWRSQLNGGGFSNVSGSSGEDTITYTNLLAGVHDFKAIVQNGACPNDTSSLAIVTVNPDVVAGTLSGGASYCTPTNSTLLSLTSYTGTVNVWQQSTNGGASFSNISGTANRDTVTFNNITNPTLYRVIVSSGACGTDTSNTQAIDVGQSVAGTLNVDDSVCISGNNALLQLTGYTGSVTGWQDSVSGGSWGATFNSGFDTLRYVNLTQTTSYRVIVKSGACDADTSNIVVITVSDTVFAGSLSQNLSFCDTINSDTLLLSGYFGPIENWYSRVNGGAWLPFSPVKTDSAFIFTNLTDSITEYRVIMDGGVCGSDTSNIVSVQVGASLGGVILTGDTVCSGNNQGVLRLIGFRGNILGWDSSTVPGIFAPINHFADTLIYIDLSDTVTYRVRVQNPGCPADTSSEVTIVTVPGTTSGILAGSRSHCSTTNTDSVILIGRIGSILLWESSINMGTSWDTVTGQLTDTFIYNNLTQTTWYRVIVQGSGICPDDTSNIVMIQIGPSDAGVISGDTQICAGSNANLLLSGYTGDIVGWENSINGGVNWNPIPGSDTNIISLNLNITTVFRAIVQSDTCDADTSAIYQVLVDQPYAGTLITPSTQLCYGIGSDTIFLSNPVDQIFDWELRADTSAFFTSLGNDTTFQRYDTLKITTHYRVFVKNGVCPIDTVGLTLTVDTFTLAGTITGDDTICSGNNTGLILLSGHIGNTFTWQSSTDGGNTFVPATGATNDTFYVYSNLTDTTVFRVVVASGGCPPDTSNSVLITVKPAAIGGLVLSDTSFCKGPNGGTLNLSGYFGTIVGWQESIGGGAFANVIPANTTDVLTFSGIDTTTSYRVILSFGDCPDDTSNVATVTVLRTPVASITPNGPTEFCEGNDVLLTAAGGPGYLWSTSDTIESITVGNTGQFTVVVTDTLTGCSDADTIDVVAFPLPNIDAGTDVVIQLGQSTQLNASGGLTYEWTPKTGLDDGFIANPNASPIDTTVYFVTSIDSNGCGGTDSVIVFIIIPPDTSGAPTFTNLFTPNGDGHNDTWNITGRIKCSQCKVAIYNRYGQEVYQDEDYSDDWEGTFNGKKLPDGTYYYVVSTEIGKIYKGAITILRGE